MGEKTVGSRETVMSRTAVASNVELLLRWIPAFAGMTAHTKKSGVRSSFDGFFALINLFRNAPDRSVVTSNFDHRTLLDS